MSRHQNYSKRSRESRKAMTEGSADEDEDDDFPDSCECATEEWSPVSDDADLPPDPVS